VYGRTIRYKSSKMERVRRWHAR